MKVICIDDRAVQGSPKPEIGQAYEVLGGETYLGFYCYLLFITGDDRHFYWEGYYIPLSDIDETEFVRDYNKQEA